MPPIRLRHLPPKNGESQALGVFCPLGTPNADGTARLEQRLGPIKRFGQVLHTADTLNLVYHDTQDVKIYQALSRRDVVDRLSMPMKIFSSSQIYCEFE